MVLYVGNFSRDTTEESLRGAFEPYGQVEQVAVIRDRMSRRGLGFGFVTMPDEQQARRAVAELSHSEFEGRTVIVAETAERTERRDDQET